MCKKKRWLYLSILTLLLIGLIIKVLVFRFSWGFEIIPGSDELRHIGRGKAIYEGMSSIFTRWDNPNKPEFYPGGLPILYAMFMGVSGTTNPYIITLLFESIFIVLILMMYYLIGSIYKEKYGLYSMFFRITIPMIFTNIPANFTFPYGEFFGSGKITEICILIGIYVIIKLSTFKLNKNLSLGLVILLFLFCTIHGVSHISTYIGFVFSIIFITIVYPIWTIISSKTPLSHENRILFMVLPVILLSISFVILIYYYPVIQMAISQNRMPPEQLTLIIPTSEVNVFNFILFFSPIALVSLAFLTFISLNSYLKSTFRHHPRTSVCSQKHLTAIVISYVSIYFIGCVLVTLYPTKYLYDPKLLITYFPMYFSTTQELISFMSVCLGLFYFVLSAFGVYYLMGSKLKKYRFIAILFFGAYLFWYLNFFFMGYYATRLQIFSYLLPFICAVGFCNINEKHSFWKTSKIKSIEIRKLKNLVIWGVIFMLVLSQAVILGSKEPAIRGDRIAINYVGIRRTINPEIFRPHDCIIINEYVNDGEYVLASRSTEEALYPATQIHVPDITWNKWDKNRSLYWVYLSAYLNLNYTNFFGCYDARYFVVTDYSIKYDVVKTNKTKIEESGQFYRMYCYEFMEVYVYAP